MQTQNQNFTQFALRQLLQISKMEPYFAEPEGMWAKGYVQAQNDMKRLITSCLSLITDDAGNLLPVE